MESLRDYFDLETQISNNNLLRLQAVFTGIEMR